MTTAMLPLRPYQRAALDRIYDAWYNVENPIERPAVVLPTGGGKTVVFAHLAREVAEAEPGTRLLVLVHTGELAQQAISKIRSVAPHLRVGLVQGSINQYNCDVVVAMVQTMRADHRLSAMQRVSAKWRVVVDECHHATAASYRKIMEALGGKAVGFTATLMRGDGAALGEVWQKVVFRKDITDMIALNFLLKVRGKRVRVPDLNLRDVKTSRGEYQEGALGEALTASLAPELVAKAYVEHCSDRQGILFAPTVASAAVFAEALCDAGIKAEMVSGETEKHERAAILKRLRDGVTQVVCNCMVLTEGFDEPIVSCVVIARPTTSAGLYTQMAGRALRPYPGQSEALIMDVVGVTGRHRLASLVDLIGDPTKIQHEPTEENLADLLIDETGLDVEGDDDYEPATRADDITYADGDTYEVVDVDLFAKSHSAWLQTAEGRWFLPVNIKGQIDRYVAIVPAGGGGLFNVAIIDAFQRGRFEYRHVGLDTAMAWGEEVMRDLGAAAYLTNKRMSWHDADVTSAQRRMAAALGIEVQPFHTKGTVSNLISVAKASKAIDPIVNEWR